MKKIASLSLVAIVSVISMNASAEVLKRRCDAKDYQLIVTALQKGRILAGQEKKNAILGVLAQEMGPQCNQLISTDAQIGIPGDKHSVFELISGSGRAEITIVTGIERRGMAVYLK